jgi:hypothetical protein
MLPKRLGEAPRYGDSFRSSTVALLSAQPSPLILLSTLSLKLPRKQSSGGSLITVLVAFCFGCFNLLVLFLPAINGMVDFIHKAHPS